MATAIQRRLPEFDLLREQAQSKAIGDEQRAQETLKRRFARQGGLGSGAFIKQTQIAQDNANRAGQDAASNIGIAELGEVRRRDESDRGFGLQKQQVDIQQGQFDLSKKATEQQLGQSSDEFERQKMADSFNLIKAAGGTTKNLQTFLTLFNKLGRIPTAKEVVAASGNFGNGGSKGPGFAERAGNNALNSIPGVGVARTIFKF
jgi:hypothetical protein